MTTHETQTARVAVLTGAAGGMGHVIALALARTDWQVVAIVRNKSRAESFLQVVKDQGLTARVNVLYADLAHREGVLTVARTIRQAHDAVHLLINNAGAHFPEHRLTEDGIEAHIAVDYLASYGLTSLLRNELTRGRARVVNVASDTLRDTRQIKIGGRRRPATVDPRDLVNLALLNPEDGFVPFEAYGRAKLLTVTAGYGLARRLQADGVTVNSVHPGIVATGIVDDLIPTVMRPLRSLIRRSMLTPDEGAAAVLRLALDPALSDLTGRYFVRDVDTATPPVSYDVEVQDLLLRTSDMYFGLTPVS